ncbi:MAG TPA: hypothetical protein VFI36_10150 [Arthrobacter sp.]|nr:hypothetical protein [Arthrobacter sp.]
MELFWPDSFEEQLDRLEEAADSGDERARAVFEYVVAEMDYLRRLVAPPQEETPTIKGVRQSRKYALWRVSHPFHEGIAVRLICWFPPGERTVVVALFSGDKANMGDVFYDSVGRRADQIIEQWIREGEDDDGGKQDIQEGQ